MPLREQGREVYIFMGKILLINGSPNEYGCTFTALKELETTLNREGLDTEFLYLGKGAMQGCTACMSCAGTGKCIFEDQVNEVTRRLDTIDGIVAGSPVYYGSPSGPLVAFLDRFCLVNEYRLYRKLAASVLSCRRGGASGAFMILNQKFLNCSMTIVGSEYWNQVHGIEASEVLKDEEGLQTMRVLGQNIAWLQKSIEAGRQAGIAAPVYEERIHTNFIR